MPDRVAVFIDGSNAYHAFKAAFGSGKYSPLALARELAGGRPIARTGYYIAAVPQQMGALLYAGQQRFFAGLKQVRELDVWTGRMACTDGVWCEKGVDVKIATDLISMAYANVYDIAILLSGDSDLVPAVREVRLLGRVVENAMPKNRKSWHLFQESSKFLTIDAAMFARCQP